MSIDASGRTFLEGEAQEPTRGWRARWGRVGCSIAVIGWFTCLAAFSALASPPVGTTPAPKAIPLSGESIRLEWRDEVEGEDGFVIERLLLGGDFAEIARVGSGMSEYVDGGLEPQRNYAYRVRAFNGAGEFYEPGNWAWVNTPALGGEYLGLTTEFAGVIYFIYNLPLRIERYALEEGRWLEPLPIDGRLLPDVFLVEAEGIYLSLGDDLWRCASDLSSRVLVDRFPGRGVGYVFIRGPHLIFGALLSEFRAKQRDSLAPVPENLTGVIPSALRVSVSRQVGGIPGNSTLGQLTLEDPWVPAAENPGPHEGRLHIGWIGWMTGDGENAIERVGSISHVRDMSYWNTLPMRPMDLSPLPDGGLLASRDHTLTRFSSRFLQVGQGNLPAEGGEFAGRRPNAPPSERVDARVLQGASLACGCLPTVPDPILRAVPTASGVVAFTPLPTDRHGLRAHRMRYEDLAPPVPAEVGDPQSVEFQPLDALLDSEEIINLLDQRHHAIYRWSTGLERYVDRLGLIAEPLDLAYSEAEHRLFVLYPDQRITVIDLRQPLRETPFANVGFGPNALESKAGTLVVSGFDLYTFFPDGTPRSRQPGASSSYQWVYSPALDQWYGFQDKQSPLSLVGLTLNPGGGFSQVTASPRSATLLKYPLRLRPDGQQLVIGSGEVFAADGLSRVTRLNQRIVDAAWLGTDLFTLGSDGVAALVEKWSPNLDRTLVTHSVPGGPLFLFALSAGRILVITQEGANPRLTFLNGELDPRDPPPVPQSPEAIVLDASSIFEGFPAGMVLGTVGIVDPTPGDRHRIELIADSSGALALVDRSLVLQRRISYEDFMEVRFSLKVTDASNLSLVQDFVLPVLDGNEPPTAIHLLPSEVPENLSVGAVVGTLSVEDPDRGDTSSFSLVSDPDGKFSLSGATLVLRSPLDRQAATTHPVRIYAQDRGGLGFEQTLSVLVAAPAPNGTYIPPIPSQETKEGEDWSFAIEARLTGNEGSGDSLHYTVIAPGAPDMTIDASGILRWTPGEAAGGTTNFIQVSAAPSLHPALVATAFFPLRVLEVNAAPQIPVVPRDPLTPGAEWQFNLSATDPDVPANRLRYGLVEAPSGLELDAASGALRWTPQPSQEGRQHRVCVEVSDDGEPALASRTCFELAVGISGLPPRFRIPATTTATENEPLRLTLVADDPEGDASRMRFRVVSGPGGFAVDTETGEVRWTPPMGSAGVEATATVEVRDAQGRTDSLLLRWLVQPATRPTLTWLAAFGGLVLTYDATPGWIYQVEVRRGSGEEAWSLLGRPVEGDGQPHDVAVILPPEGSALFRLRLWRRWGAP